MPRFGTRTLLVVFGLLAVWFATFGASATSLAATMAAQDVRRSMLLLVLVAATGLASVSRGRQRAFWSAFAIVMFLCGGMNLQRPLYRYVPDFAWQQTMGVNLLVPVPYAPPAVSSMITPGGPVVYSAPSPYMAGMGAMASAPGWSAASETAAAAWTFVLAGLSGLIAAYIYSRSRAAATVAGGSSAARQIVEQELNRTERG